MSATALHRSAGAFWPDECPIDVGKTPILGLPSATADKRTVDPGEANDCPAEWLNNGCGTLLIEGRSGSSADGLEVGTVLARG